MANKTSAAQKLCYSRYRSESRKDKNKAAKLARHLKKHPNDLQSANRVTPPTAGKDHIKRTPLEAATIRSMNTGAFGKDV